MVVCEYCKFYNKKLMLFYHVIMSSFHVDWEIATETDWKFCHIHALKYAVKGIYSFAHNDVLIQCRNFACICLALGKTQNDCV